MRQDRLLWSFIHKPMFSKDCLSLCKVRLIRSFVHKFMFSKIASVWLGVWMYFQCCKSCNGVNREDNSCLVFCYVFSHFSYYYENLFFLHGILVGSVHLLWWMMAYYILLQDVIRIWGCMLICIDKMDQISMQHSIFRWYSELVMSHKIFQLLN